jgi:4-carboxymuconolactone decarboxylase
MSDLKETANTVFTKIFGDEESKRVRKMISDLSPELERIGIDYPFGEFYVHEDLLDLRSRELITISTLVTQGTLPQLKLHMKAALNVGCTPIEIEQTLLQLIVYVGMPKVINAFIVYKELLDENN